MHGARGQERMGDRIDLLEQLADLRRSGALTQAEFEEQKRQVLHGPDSNSDHTPEPESETRSPEPESETRDPSGLNNVRKIMVALVLGGGLLWMMLPHEWRIQPTMQESQDVTNSSDLDEASRKTGPSDTREERQERCRDLLLEYATDMCVSRIGGIYGVEHDTANTRLPFYQNGCDAMKASRMVDVAAPYAQSELMGVPSLNEIEYACRSKLSVSGYSE